jgi:hypothetical protein
MDDLKLICACGRSTRITGDLVGGTGQCIHCGAKVRVTETNTRPLTQAERDVDLFCEEPEEIPRLAPSPKTGPDILLVPPAPQTIRTTGAEVPPPSPAAPGAEADTPPVQGTQPPEPRWELALADEDEPQPIPRGEAPETHTRTSRGRPPPSAEVDSFLEDDRQRLLDLRKRGEPVSPPAPPGIGKSDQTRCPRCGRAYRGPWDRVAVGYETLCHVCANRIEMVEHSVTPLKTEKPGQVMREIARQGSWGASKHEEEAAQESLAQDTKRKRTREMIILAVAAVITITAISLWPTQNGPKENARPETSAAVAKDAPTVPGYVITGIRLALQVAGVVLALYCTLRVSKRLPEGSLRENLGSLLINAGIFFVVRSGADVLMSFVAVVPFIWVLGLVVKWVILGCLLYLMYEFLVTEVLIFILFSVLTGILAEYIEMLIFGVLGLSLY